MIKYICDQCKKDITERGSSGVLIDGKNLTLCVKCFKKLMLMRKEVDRRFLRGESLEFTPTKTPQNMKTVGFNNHDCESWYACPECGKEYGSWGFFHKHMRPKTVFNCEDCGTPLIVPE